MKLKRKKKIARQVVAPEYNDFGRAYAIAYRYGERGRVFCVQCPFCEGFIESPFRRGHRWELPDLILRRKVSCDVCGVELGISAKYRIIEEDKE